MITLTGANPQVIECPAAYTELGATATDACDLGLGAVVIDASAVNTNLTGAYTVTYNIADAAGNAATQVTRTVNVVDTTDPVVAITSPAAGDKFYPGASVDVVYTAVDACDSAPTVVVTPGNPTLLPSTGLPQDIVLTVQATDASGNVGSASVTVLVQGPQDFAGDLIVEVNLLVTNGALNGGQGNSLVRKLEHIINKIDRGQINSALGQLQAFIDEVSSHVFNGVLSSADGQPLIDGAQAIVDFPQQRQPRRLSGCPRALTWGRQRPTRSIRAPRLLTSCPKPARYGWSCIT